MSADNAEVIQGRLGWEAGDVSEANPEELQPHPKNEEIYGDTADIDDLDDTFVESIDEKGVLEPLVITNGKQIISGHRRWLAAQEAGKESVPVRYSEFDNELAEREALIEFNRQREKTPPQILNEYEEMLAIEKLRANLNKGNKGNGGSDSTQDGKDLSTASARAADKIDAQYTGETLEKGREVKDKATDDSEPEEVQEAAQEAWQDLKSGDESFSGAHERVEDADPEPTDGDSESDSDNHDLDVLTSQETDEWSSPQELVEPLDAAVGGFDLDPCSGAENSPFAAETYTEADDGLAQEWFGTVWVNPPYSEMSAWTEKATTADADVVYYLCKGDSSTEWWQQAIEAADALCCIDHRLSFGDGGNSAPFASHIFVFGEPSQAAIEELQNHGAVLPEVFE
jgi:phage N-6-adenine-methyltransferase